MAGLNDDVMDDLVVPPTETKTEGPSLNLVTSDTNKEDLDKNQITPEKLFGDAIEPGKLPDLNANIAIISDKHSKVVEFKEIESMILGQEAICQEEAREIEATMGSFLGPRLSLREFSLKPSKINYDYSMRFVQSRISQEEMVMLTHLKTFFTEPVEEICVFHNHLENLYLPKLVEQFRKFRLTFDSLLVQLSESRNTIIPINGDFINVMNVPISTFDHAESVERFFNGVMNPEAGFASSIRLLKTLLDSPPLADFICISSVNAKINPPTAMSLASATHQSSELTLTTLVNFYESSFLETNLTELQKFVYSAVKFFEETDEALGKETQDYSVINPVAVDRFVTEHSTEAQVRSEHVAYVNQVIHGLLRLNHVMVSVVSFLKVCL